MNHPLAVEPCSTKKLEPLRIQFGVVQSWAAGRAQVLLEPTVSCGACPAHSACAVVNQTQSANLIVTARSKRPFTVGQRVRLAKRFNAATQPRLLVVVLLLSVMAAAAWTVLKLGGTDTQAALSALVVAIVWILSSIGLTRRLAKKSSLEIVDSID